MHFYWASTLYEGPAEIIAFSPDQGLVCEKPKYQVKMIDL